MEGHANPSPPKIKRQSERPSRYTEPAHHNKDSGSHVTSAHTPETYERRLSTKPADQSSHIRSRNCTNEEYDAASTLLDLSRSRKPPQDELGQQHMRSPAFRQSEPVPEKKPWGFLAILNPPKEAPASRSDVQEHTPQDKRGAAWNSKPNEVGAIPKVSPPASPQKQTIPAPKRKPLPTLSSCRAKPSTSEEEDSEAAPKSRRKVPKPFAVRLYRHRNDPEWVENFKKAARARPPLVPVMSDGTPVEPRFLVTSTSSDGENEGSRAKVPNGHSPPLPSNTEPSRSTSPEKAATPARPAPPASTQHQSQNARASITKAQLTKHIGDMMAEKSSKTQADKKEKTLREYRIALAIIEEGAESTSDPCMTCRDRDWPCFRRKNPGPRADRCAGCAAAKIGSNLCSRVTNNEVNRARRELTAKKAAKGASRKRKRAAEAEEAAEDKGAKPSKS
ncbi:uncharacterized protein JN550_013494 [Neoarthrinium moseri]|uniref:uncharacterized protein n=1 Tax=Neoarthrinium moseri TaxID=1658444 RepID=UPI001FDBB8E1|nr:uncharacterized protein JN550_013494 [Neoarthrinium moseri]KAI1857001.1 hypothetical protein JN550_013494 [Neoarthrinium moseri]